MSWKSLECRCLESLKRLQRDHPKDTLRTNLETPLCGHCFRLINLTAVRVFLKLEEEFWVTSDGLRHMYFFEETQYVKISLISSCLDF